MATRNLYRSQSPSPPHDQAGAPSHERPEENLSINDVADTRQRDVLTPNWSPRLSRPPILPSAPTSHRSPSSESTIQSRQTNNFNNTGHDVRPILNLASGHSTQSPSIQDGHSYNAETTVPSYQNPTSPYDSLNLSNRPRTSYPVFNSTSDLAAHHGIPHKLPPIPTAHHRPPVPRFNEPHPVPQSTECPTSPVFENLMSNYLDMLSKKPEDITSVNTPAALPPAMDVNDTAAAHHLAEALIATPEWNEYLTSPFDESPLDAILETPVLDSADFDAYLTSPVVPDSHYFESFGDIDLFPELSKMSVSTMTPSSSNMPNFDGLIPISPYTPSLDPQQIFSPNMQQESPTQSSLSLGRRVKPTGTRKNISLEALVPIDAPTQPRSYVTPSSTSRKDLPAVFAKKRARSMAFGDEEDELIEEALDPNAAPPTQTEAEAIAAKRRQNTLAARRSRKRKLEYQRQLEDEVDKERQEKEMWRQRALMCREQLQSYGVLVPFPDE